MVAAQMTMPDTVVPGSYTVLDWTVQGWVHVTGHRVWPDGARFLALSCTLSLAGQDKGGQYRVVRPWHGGWLLCWRDGVKPQPEKRLGALLREGQVERV